MAGLCRPPVPAMSPGMNPARVPFRPRRYLRGSGVGHTVPEVPAIYGPSRHGLLQLVEGTDLDLSDPLARDHVLLGQLLKCGRILLQPALDENVSLAHVQRLERTAEQGLAASELLALGDGGFLAAR